MKNTSYLSTKRAIQITDKEEEGELKNRCAVSTKNGTIPVGRGYGGSSGEGDASCGVEVHYRRMGNLYG